MFEAELAAVVSFIGILVQLCGGLLLVLLFLLLRRYVLRRSYFAAWTAAWACGAVAIGALAVRYLIVPRLVPDPDGAAVLIGALYLLYQAGKLASLGLFVLGTVNYVAGARLSGPRNLVALLVLTYGAASVIGSGLDLNEMVVWQAPVAVVALGACAALLLTLPPSRRTLGSVAGGAAFAGLALLWLLYGIAFATAGTPQFSGWAQVMVRFNTYFDLLFNIALGFAMVVLLMEDGKREVDDAQAELRVAHDQLKRAALYDSLTDSLNRRAFAQGVGLEMARGTFGTVVIADVDNLKAVNDSYGHAAGDRMLRACADRLRSALRPYDKLYRWGGDEFLLVLPSARSSDVSARLRDLLSRIEPLDVPGGQQIPIEVSLGAADYTSAEQLDGAIQDADAEMYRQKQARKSPEAGVRAINVPSRPVSVRL